MLRLLVWTSCRIYLKLLYSDRVITFPRHAHRHRHLSVPHAHTHSPITVIYFSLQSVRVQAGCNQRGQTANGSVTFWLSNALWPIWELSLLRIANRWSRPTPPSPSMFDKGELHGDKMDVSVCVCVCVWWSCDDCIQEDKTAFSFFFTPSIFGECLLNPFFCQTESTS